MKPLFILGVIAGVVLLILYWTPSNRRKFETAQQEIRWELARKKNNTKEDLLAIRRAIHKKMDRVSDKLEKANVGKKSQLNKIKKDLSGSKETIQLKIDSLHNAMQESSKAESKENKNKTN